MSSTNNYSMQPVQQAQHSSDSTSDVQHYKREKTRTCDTVFSDLTKFYRIEIYNLM